jgi:hypothetical protein
MSYTTAWYIADEDGNLGLIDFDRTGPIPIRSPYEAVVPDMYFGEAFFEDSFSVCIKMTDEQIKSLLVEDVKRLTDYSFYASNIYVEIDKARKDLFFEYAKKDDDFLINGCLSDNLGIYSISTIGEYTKKGTLKVRSALKKIKDADLIKKVFEVKDISVCEMYDEYYDDKGNLIREEPRTYYDVLPYFLYYQSDRINIPTKNVMHISQVEEKFRDKILRVPGKFKDLKYLQIAEWYPSDIYYYSWWNIKKVGDLYYALMKLTNGEEAYVRVGAEDIGKLNGMKYIISVKEMEGLDALSEW